MPKLLVASKQFQIMQHPAFDAVISKYWSGKFDLSVHIFHCSSSYRLAWQAPFLQVEDEERGWRSEAFCFNREELKHFPHHRFSFTGLYLPMNMRFNLDVLIVFSWMCVAIARTLDLYGVVKDMTFRMNSMQSIA